MKTSLFASKKSLQPVSTRRGSALVNVLIFSSIMLLIAGASVTSVTNQTRSTGRSLSYKQSIALAEAGAEVALAQLNVEGNTWSGWTSQGSSRVLANQTLTDAGGKAVGTYSVTVIDADSANPLIDSVGSAQIGSNGPVQRKIRIPLLGNTTPSPFGEYGIYSSGDIDFGNNNFIHGISAAKNNITVKNPHEIDDLQAGNSVFQRGIKTEIDIVEGSMPTTPPTFPDDALLDAQAQNSNDQIYAINNKGEKVILGVPTDGNYDFTPYKTIHFPAGTYYLDHLVLSSNSNIIVDGAVKLYMNPGEGNVAIDMTAGTNTINYEGDPENMQIFVKSGSIAFGQNFYMWAGLFAPDADLADFQSNTWLHGAIIANNITLAGNSGISVDEDLLRSTNDGGYFAQSWTEVAASLE